MRGVAPAGSFGLRGEFWVSDDVRLIGWGDYGGFGVGSESTWQLVFGASYLPSPNVELYAAYRILSFDYEEGSGADRLSLDLTYSGPMIGIGYRF